MTFLQGVSLFLLSQGISTIFGESPFYSLMRSTSTYIIIVGALVAYRYYHMTRNFVFFTCSTFGVFLCIGNLLQIYNNVHLEPGVLYRANGFMPHFNDLAIVPVLAPFMFTWGLAPALLAMLLGGSRNAILGSMVVLVFSTWRYRWYLLGGISSAFMFSHMYHPSGGFITRLGHWALATQMFWERPDIGFGPYTFVDHYFKAVTTYAKPYGVPLEMNYIPWAHSLYYELLSERGIFGFVAILLPLTLCFWHRNLAAATSAFLIMGIFDLTFLKPWVVVVYFFLLLLGLAEKEYECGMV